MKINKDTIIAVLFVVLFIAFIMIVSFIVFSNLGYNKTCVQEEVVCYYERSQTYPPMTYKTFGDCENPHYNKMQKRCIAWEETK